MSDNKGKVVLCTPVLQGNGCKYIATNLANYYKAMHNDRKVALVDFDFKSPYLASSLASHDEVHGIDNLIDKIDGGFLTDDLFKENMVKLKNNVELLKGTKLVGNHKIFNKKHIEVILEHFRSLYDFVVVAVAPTTDNAGTVYGYFNADEIVLVGRNNISNFKAIERVVATAKHHAKAGNNLKLLFNMYNEASQINFNARLKELEIDILGAIKYDESTIDNVDLGGSSFKVFKTKNKPLEVYEPIIKMLED